VVAAVIVTAVFAAGLEAVAVAVVVVVVAGLAFVFSCAEETLASALKQRAQSAPLVIDLFFIRFSPFVILQVL
jgi:hypothetical protein